MITVQNIHQNIIKANRALSTWLDSLCGDTVIGFTYNNEPKQGYTEV